MLALKLVSIHLVEVSDEIIKIIAQEFFITAALTHRESVEFGWHWLVRVIVLLWSQFIAAKQVFGIDLTDYLGCRLAFRRFVCSLGLSDLSPHRVFGASTFATLR